MRKSGASRGAREGAMARRGEGRKIFFSRRHGEHGEVSVFRILRCGRCGAVRELVTWRFGASRGEEIACEGAEARGGRKKKLKGEPMGTSALRGGREEALGVLCG
jgi:hypothetical protein